MRALSNPCEIRANSHRFISTLREHCIFIHVPKDLNRLLMPEPVHRFRQMRTSEQGLEALGIRPGDLLLIDVDLRPQPGCLVVATINGRFWARRWERTSGMVHLATGGVSGPLTITSPTPARSTCTASSPPSYTPPGQCPSAGSTVAPDPPWLAYPLEL